MSKPTANAPTIGAQGGVIGRPRKEPPACELPAHAEQPQADATHLIEDLAADGWSIVGIAWKLGTSAKTLRRWFAEAPALLEAFEVGRERERRTLHNTAFRMSQECEEPAVKLRATMYLLNTRHSYSEPSSEGNSARVNVVIQMPAARPIADFIEGEVER